MNETAKQTSDNTNPAKRHVIVGNDRHGLYYGETSATDQDIITTRSVRLENCRHIRRWRGKTGGITSLAAHGPRGPQAQQSRIGAPAPSSLLTGVVTVFECSDEAVEAFAEIDSGEPWLLARIESGERRLLERIDTTEQRLLAELARHTRASHEDMLAQIATIDEKYADLPARMNQLCSTVSIRKQR